MNEVKIENLKRIGSLTQKQVREWTQELQSDGRPVGIIRVLYYWGLLLTSGAMILLVAAFYLNYLTFSGIGFASLELALVATVSIVLIFEIALRSFASWWWNDDWKKLIVFLIASLAGVGLFVAQGFLGYIRGSIIEEATFVSPSLLSFLFPLLTVAIEMGGCISFHEGMSNIWLSSRALWLHRKITLGEHAIIDIARQIDELNAEIEVEAADNSVQHDLDGTQEKKMILKRLMIGLVAMAAVLIGIGISRANGAECSVILLDLSRSSQLTDQGGAGNEFQKNIDAITNLIRKLNTGSWTWIVGITDQSLSRPFVILKGSISVSRGLFGEKTEFEKKRLVKEFKVVANTLRPDFKASDILGAIYLGSNLFPRRCQERRLTIYSDMRHIDHRFDLQNVPVVPLDLLKAIEKKGLIPSLIGVKVFVQGAHPIGKNEGYWQSLKAFWVAYFQKANGKLQTYSINQEVHHE